MSIYSTLYKKRGAHIKPIASATTLQISYSLHSAHPLWKTNTATCQQVRNTGKNPSVVLSTLAIGFDVILLAKRTEHSCPSLTESDGSIGPRALRSCPLLLEDPVGGTIRDGLKAEVEFTATSGLCVFVCVCPVSPQCIHMCVAV